MLADRCLFCPTLTSINDRQNQVAMRLDQLAQALLRWHALRGLASDDHVDHDATVLRLAVTAYLFHGLVHSLFNDAVPHCLREELARGRPHVKIGSEKTSTEDTLTLDFRAASARGQLLREVLARCRLQCS